MVSFSLLQLTFFDLFRFDFKVYLWRRLGATEDTARVVPGMDVVITYFSKRERPRSAFHRARRSCGQAGN